MNPGRENKNLFGLRESLCDVGHSHVEKLSRFRSISGAVKYVIIVYSMKTYVKRRKIIVRWGQIFWSIVMMFRIWTSKRDFGLFESLWLWIMNSWIHHMAHIVGFRKPRDIRLVKPHRNIWRLWNPGRVSLWWWSSLNSLSNLTDVF